MLYIHIPFCDSKCPYCSFNSYVGKKNLEERYLKALLEDFKKEMDRYKKDSFETLYIGGGTPSVLNPSFYEELFKTIEPYIKDTKEMTIEANPNSFTTSFAKTILALGVDRISFGVQSLDKKKLSLLGRKHTKKEALDALELALNAGFKRVSADLIYGVKGDSLELLKSDIEMLLSYDIEHMSAYSLSIEEGSGFYTKPQMSIDSSTLGAYVKSTLESFGLKQYEVSNYGKKPSLHNQNYWKGNEYMGIGAGAVGFSKNRRVTKERDIEKYISYQGSESEILSDEELRFERLFMGLRSDIGVSLRDIKASDRVLALQKEGTLFIDKGRVFCTDYFLADEIALFLEK